MRTITVIYAVYIAIFEYPVILRSILLLACLFGSGIACHATVTPDLAYAVEVTGDVVMQQSYFVNRHFAFDNIQIGQRDAPVRMVLKNGERLNSGNTLIRYLNNRPSRPEIRFQDKVVFPTGKIRGTAILVVSYLNEPAAYSIWLPALRKVRRVSEPAHDDLWGGSPLTYGDVYFRLPEHEQHELIAAQVFNQCLDTLELDAAQSKHVRTGPPAQSCDAKGRPVYQVKSTTRFEDWWYDYRLVTVDRKTFADYRSDYYKADRLIKRIDKDWRNLSGHDPRAVMWRYWYAVDYRNGQQAIGFVDPSSVLWNREVNPRDWTERALRKMKR